MASSNDSLTTAALEASASFAKEVECGQQTTEPVDIFQEIDTPEIRRLTTATLNASASFAEEVECGRLTTATLNASASFAEEVMRNQRR